jgi:DNA (cytosine-5)-methyltransferase 1
LFPGIGLLDMAFEAEGFCIVRGPDLIFGGNIKSFNPPSGRFDGVIGGPPCQAFSRLRHLVKSLYGEDRIKPNMIPEYERVVRAVAPAWFVMENVPDAPEPCVPGYVVKSTMVNNRWLGAEQNRARRFSFGTLDGLRLQVETELTLANPTWEPTVCATAGGRRVPVKQGGSGKVKKTWQGGALSHETTRPIGVMCALQGLPADFLDGTPFTLEGKRIMIGNAVPLPMGRAVAKAVKRALGIELEGRQAA